MGSNQSTKRYNPPARTPPVGVRSATPDTESDRHAEKAAKSQWEPEDKPPPYEIADEVATNAERKARKAERKREKEANKAAKCAGEAAPQVSKAGKKSENSATKKAERDANRASKEADRAVKRGEKAKARAEKKAGRALRRATKMQRRSEGRSACSVAKAERAVRKAQAGAEKAKAKAYEKTAKARKRTETAAIVATTYASSPRAPLKVMAPVKDEATPLSPHNAGPQPAAPFMLSPVSPLISGKSDVPTLFPLNSYPQHHTVRRELPSFPRDDIARLELEYQALVMDTACGIPNHGHTY
ncbi:hypothetical protein CspeluHIS016_0304130 [Cutaneotrichosporon spelunceum]|uniref:Uncharacterized protein n=1 Tax=Cutaneotrichosporon spelunceum TaxID=1672016 RepID=A0AAD3YBY5_9TREE|nr:hypothetical protein CspeluHIS016_0304130 [Cutaneotrichosporon spelunceum]